MKDHDHVGVRIELAHESGIEGLPGSVQPISPSLCFAAGAKREEWMQTTSAQPRAFQRSRRSALRRHGWP